MSGGLSDTEDYWLTLDPETDGATAKAYAPSPESTYCPISGQFVSTDPIRIDGGARLHGFVLSATNFIDPFGLVGNCCCNGTVFELLVGPYAENGGHHLNQGAAYAHGDNSTYRQMLTATLPGNVFTEPGSPHFRAHESMEAFWDRYRRGGYAFGSSPTNADYDRALRSSLTAAGLDTSTAHQLADQARAERIAAGFMDNDPVPRVPGQINSVRNGSNCR